MGLRIVDDEYILLKVHDCNEAFALLAAQLWAFVLMFYPLPLQYYLLCFKLIDTCRILLIYTTI